MVVTVDSIGREIIYGATGVQEVFQNVRTLLTTRAGTQPLDREFGIDFSFIDSPMPVARAKVNTEIFEKIKKYEPRAVLKNIDFDFDAIAGRMSPKVTIEVVL